jgi:uncharacterized cupin superfamily protein
MCPFHYHMLEDEVFFIISGRGVLRCGEEVRPLRAGDCVYCPAGTRVAHQLANPFDEDLVYLAIGPHNPNAREPARPLDLSLKKMRVSFPPQPS